MTVTLSDADRAELQVAKNLLENPGLAVKITSFIGAPIEKGLALLPKDWHERIGDITQSALLKSADAAMFTMKDIPGEASANIWHKLGVAVSGGAGGFFGLAGIAAELPVSTTLILRSIADVARSQGESISSIDTRLACLEVFALGGEGGSDDAAESGYYAVRSALAKSVTEAAGFLAKKSVTDSGAPVLVKFVSKVAERFGLQVTKKVAAQAVPAIGAAGGAIINLIFIDHFQDMARGHFIVRKLERKHGTEAVQRLYLTLPKQG
jgi:hypothetical protein